MQMHMAGCTFGEPLQLMNTIHHAYTNVMNIMKCTMISGRLQNKFMRDLSSHQTVAEKVADDHQVLCVTTQKPTVQEQGL